MKLNRLPARRPHLKEVQSSKRSAMKTMPLAASHDAFLFHLSSRRGRNTRPSRDIHARRQRGRRAFATVFMFSDKATFLSVLSKKKFRNKWGREQKKSQKKDTSHLEHNISLFWWPEYRTALSVPNWQAETDSIVWKIFFLHLWFIYFIPFFFFFQWGA